MLAAGGRMAVAAAVDALEGGARADSMLLLLLSGTPMRLTPPGVPSPPPASLWLLLLVWSPAPRS